MLRPAVKDEDELGLFFSGKTLRDLVIPTPESAGLSGPHLFARDQGDFMT